MRSSAKLSLASARIEESNASALYSAESRKIATSRKSPESANGTNGRDAASASLPCGRVPAGSPFQTNRRKRRDPMKHLKLGLFLGVVAVIAAVLTWAASAAGGTADKRLATTGIDDDDRRSQRAADDAHDPALAGIDARPPQWGHVRLQHGRSPTRTTAQARPAR
jgi:hypothetical protein